MILNNKSILNHEGFRQSEIKATSNELLRIIDNTSADEICEDMKIACELYSKEVETLNEYDLLWILGIIYQAGKVQGIRQERKRKRMALR